MAIVGEAYVVVRANTSSVERDIRKGFNGVGNAAASAGKSAGQKFNQGFKSSSSDNVFGKFSAGLRSAVAGADAARNSFHNLIRAGYGVGTALAGAVGGISAMIGGLSALVGAAGAAASALAAVGNVVASIGLGLGVAKLALGGVGKAVSALNKPATGGGGGGGGGSSGSKGTAGTPGTAATVSEAAQKAFAKAMRSANESVAESEKNLAQVIEQNRESLVDANNDVRDAQISLNDAIREGQEEIKQLGFEAEDAALSEKAAALQLEKARAGLLAVQDLPPNNAARLAAELAYQEADLNLRKAKDASATLNAEQARLAKTGVAGTQVVRDATAALAEAQQAKGDAVIDSLRRQQEAEQELARAQRDRAETAAEGPDVTPGTEGTPGTPGSGGSSAGGGGGGGADPFAGLNQAQIDFAKFIASLKPKFDELKRIAAEGFLPPLQTAIQNLVDRAFPTVAEGVGIIARSMGVAVNYIVDAITSARDLSNLSTIFVMAGNVIEDLGLIIGNLFSSLLTIMAAAAPLTERFTGFLVTATTKFDAFLSRAQDDGSLTTFFNNAGDIAADFGEIFGNIFEGIGAVITDTFAEGSGGQIMIQFLKDATAGFAELGSTVEGKADLRKFFQDVATNAVAVFDLLGDILGVFFEIGANPAIGEAANTLKGAIPALQAIVDASVAAAPAFAELVVKVVEIIAALQDTGAIQVFFDTLSGIADVILAAFGNETAVAILTFTGRIAAVGLAFGTVFKAADFGFKALTGIVALASDNVGRFVTVGKGIGEVKGAMDLVRGGAGSLSEGLGLLAQSGNPVAKSVGSIGGAVSGLGGVLGSVGGVLKTAFTSPVGIVLGLIALLAGAFITLYNTSDTFRAGVQSVFGKVIEIFTTVSGAIMTALAPLIPVLLGTFQQIITSLQPAFEQIAGSFGEVLTAFQPLVGVITGELVPAFAGLVSALAPVLAQLITGLVPVMGTVVSAAAPLVTTLVGALVPVFSTLLSAIVPLVSLLLTSFVPVIATLLSAIAPLVTLLVSALVPVFQLLIAAIVPVVELLVSILVPIIQVLATVIGLVTPVIVVLANILVTALTYAIGFVVSLITDFSGTWGAIWQGISDFFGTIWNVIVLIVTTYVNLVITIITTVVTAIQAFWSMVWQAISDFFGAIWAGIVLYVTTYVNLLMTIVTTVINAIQAVWNTVWGAISSFISAIWSGIVAYVTNYVNTLRSVIEAVIRGIQSVWNNIWNAISSFISNLWNGIVNFVSGAINNLRNIISNILNAISSTWNGIWNGIKSFFNGIWDAIVAKVNTIGQTFQSAFAGIAGAISGAFASALGTVKSSVNGVIRLVNQAIGALNGLSVSVPAWVPGIGGQTFSLNIPRIPQLAKGGVVMPSNGGTLVNVAEAGRPERVEPLDENGLSDRDKAMIQFLTKGSMSGVQIVVNAAPGQSETEIAEMVSREISFMMRKGGM